MGTDRSRLIRYWIVQGCVWWSLTTKPLEFILSSTVYGSKTILTNSFIINFYNYYTMYSLSYLSWMAFICYISQLPTKFFSCETGIYKATFLVVSEIFLFWEWDTLTIQLCSFWITEIQNITYARIMIYQIRN